ncbi:single-stranded DNA-binding protein A [Oxobacter pfennigii]|uniref:Single-stranded DNA-binding protein A n=1 Tax=Oxobacter pfennigii TaxID=36849 RepID=A0A0P8Y6Z9_9CLOT|nr:single-stranded DNA-binding protein A [Oxobacter pfennigii]
MVDNVITSNKAYVEGSIASEPEFSHEMYGEGFYNFNINVGRLSDVADLLPITISERLIDGVELTIGKYVIVEGQLRSYNKYTDGGNRLILTIFARDVSFDGERTKNPNQIYLDGFICKKPVYRTTPFGREITDMLVAVNRPYNKSDYIPAIAWGRNARFSEKLNVGDHVRIWGRIQSREYQKKLGEAEVITKTAYEVSISKMEKVEEEIQPAE